MNSLSGYLIESVLSKNTDVYRKAGKLIFDYGKSDTEYQDAKSNLDKYGAKQFFASKRNSYLNVIALRTAMFNNEEKTEYCLYSDNVQPTIIVIAPGPFEDGKIACALRYSKDIKSASVKPDTETHLIAAHFFRFDGKNWTRVSGPDLKSYNDPREHQDEINSMLI